MFRKTIQSGLDLVPANLKRKGMGVIVLLTLSAALDFFSLATFVPLIVLIVNPSSSYLHQTLTSLDKITGITDAAQFTILLTVIAFLFIVIKTQLNLWITRRKAAYAYSIANVIASDAMATYLQTSYQKFAEGDYTREMNKLSNLPLVYANNFIIPLGTALAELLVLLFLFVAAALIYPPVVIIFFVLILPLMLIYRFQRLRMKHVSDEIKIAYPKLLKRTLQAVEALVEIRIFNKEIFFKRRFTKTFTSLSETFVKDHVSLTSSSRITEVIAAFSVCAFIIFALLSGRTQQETILLLSLYAGASFRAIPSINRIYASVSQIKTHAYALQDLKGMLTTHLKDSEAIPSNYEAISFQKTVALNNISFGYTTREFILKNINLTIHRGEKIVILGKSGAGKTTLFLLLMRFLKESLGELKIDSKVIEDSHALSFRKLIGYVPQNPYILDGTVTENIAFGVEHEMIDHNKIKKLLLQLDLSTWAESLPEQNETIIGEKGMRISGGQRQRLAIARALYHDATIFLLDEITNQLDHQTENEVLKLLGTLTEMKKTIVLITHRTNLTKSFDAAYHLSDGHLKKLENKELHENTL